MNGSDLQDGARVVIAGGGIAGLEAALALTDLAGDRFRIRLLSPEPEFHYKPLTVEEPFTRQPAARLDLSSALGEIGIEVILGSLDGVDVGSHTLDAGSGGEVGYDVLAVCTGGRARPAYEGVETFWSDHSDIPIDDLIRRAHGSEASRLDLVVPTRTSWSLPLYELALMTRRRTEELELADLGLRILTPEDAPLGVFGTVASGALAELLAVRRIATELGCAVSQPEAGGPLHASSTGESIDPELVLALPQILGNPVEGLPADADGFVPIDRHARVIGADDAYAAGDGTNFPVKQGGIATQMADAAAEHIAMRVGALQEARPFEPVLRGQLLTGMESLHMKHELTGGHGEGAASLDYLWWPPQKVAGKYLAAWLGHTEAGDLEAPSRPIEVEVSWPGEWHGTPMTYDAEVSSSES
jgi:sulfide:quinone oxidoreductase